MNESKLIFIDQSGNMIFYTIRNDLTYAFIDNVVTENET